MEAALKAVCLLAPARCGVMTMLGVVSRREVAGIGSRGKTSKAAPKSFPARLEFPVVVLDASAGLCQANELGEWHVGRIGPVGRLTVPSGPLPPWGIPLSR